MRAQRVGACAAAPQMAGQGGGFLLCLILLFLTNFPSTILSGSVFVQESGVEEVPKFSTAITFYLEIKSTCEGDAHVTVTPDECCLLIEKDDVDCGVIELRPLVTVELSIDDDTKRAEFIFHNLYTRFRKGNCTFILSSTAKNCPVEWKHSFNFNTYPAGEEHSCPGIDQDPDRGPCSPADCAIKYKGKRNFYRSSTGKCEPVVECNTRGEDGASIVAYYDWDNNYCHRLDWINDNSITQTESDTEIPSKIDPSQMKHFPDFEPQKLKEMAKEGKYTLKCNHGTQNGIYCDCEDGWMSSGIHQDDPMTFHWCDTQVVDPSSFSYRPRKLSKVQEVFLVIFLSLANCILTPVWCYLVYKLYCKDKCLYLYGRLRGTYKYTQLSQQ